VDDVDLATLYARDGGRCGICRRPVPEKPPGKRHPQMPSVDHVVPLSHGGEHSYANTRLAHLSCNVQRGNRGVTEQLALIG
jgi:5-methylcytosine-specific restriction endonuclease McrA